MDHPPILTDLIETCLNYEIKAPMSYYCITAWCKRQGFKSGQINLIINKLFNEKRDFRDLLSHEISPFIRICLAYEIYEILFDHLSNLKPQFKEPK